MRSVTFLCVLASASAFVAPRDVHLTRSRTVGERRQFTGSQTQIEAVTKEPSGLPLSAEVDYDALLKYHGSIVVEMALIGAFLKSLDVVLGATGLEIPYWATVPIFYGLSLKSRVFNPLRNDRPNMSKAVKGEGTSRGFGDRKMPSWTPPGVVFPIMWLLIIGPLRAYSSALVYGADGHVFFHPAIMALMFHLSVGDVWNTINNIEKRYGAAVTGVLCVTASALNAAYQYYTVDPLAGNLLGLPMIWFAVATSLVTATWQLNPTTTVDGKEEVRDPFFPVVGAAKTEFAWFGNNDESP